jgi:alkylation response protein AidB-like acyl-CoA dehydrogenase
MHRYRARRKYRLINGKACAVIDFELSSAHEQLRSAVQTAAVEQLRPLRNRSDVEGCLSDAVATTLVRVDALQQADPGQGDVDAATFCHAVERLGWGDQAVAYAWMASRQVAWLLKTCGSEEQQKKYLGRYTDSAIVPASLFLYEGFGRGPSELTTVASRDGEGWIVEGRKIAVAFAGQAEVSIVAAREEDGAQIAFVVESVEPAAVQFTGVDERRIALSGVPIASTATLSKLRVGSDAVLARGAALAHALGVCRLVHAATCLGIAEAATRYAADWSMKRTAFGRQLAGFQGVSFVLADLFMEIESTRVGLHNAVAALSEPDKSPLEAEEVDELVTPIVSQSSHLLRDAAREGVELMGVHGVITEHPTELIFRVAPLLASIDFDPLHNPVVLR